MQLTDNLITLDFGTPNPKQERFFLSRTRYTAYGGARGGGKSWAVRVKAAAGALRWPGIRILILRRTYPELENTLILPMLELLGRAVLPDGSPAGARLFTYRVTDRTITFANGSRIRFGHLQTASAVTEYQGQEYDWIFLDEATHFTEWEFRTLAATLRGVTTLPRRMYLTCNPGGVGHQWVKRLFVSREYRRGEVGGGYSFIPATVEDNEILLKGSPDYLAQLELLPDDLRAAHRYGDWDALAGRYFSEFSRERHVTAPFPIPPEWPRYRCFDYGLDMFACLWFAVDFDGRVWVYREFCESGLIISDAAGAMTALTAPGERVRYTVAPPDMWSTQKDTGRTMAEVFTRSGVGLVKASNSRVQGWLTVKEFLKLRPDGKPGLIIFSDCRRLIRDLEALQHDDKNPSDAAKNPHDVTHAPDALRYGLIFRTAGAERVNQSDEDEEDMGENWLTGGEPQEFYFTF